MGSTFYSKRLNTEFSRNRKKRPKTFKSVEAAKTWADANKISSYDLVNLKSEGSRSMKIKVVEKAAKKEAKAIPEPAVKEEPAKEIPAQSS